MLPLGFRDTRESRTMGFNIVASSALPARLRPRRPNTQLPVRTRIMPLFVRTLQALALGVSTLLLSTLAVASEPHGWCTTGAPMIPNGSSDPTTADVLVGV